MMGNGRGRGEDQSRDKCAGHDIRVSHSCSMFSKFKIGSFGLLTKTFSGMIDFTD